MTKKIIWMQGFDHLPEYAATSSAASFASFLNKYSLVAPWTASAVSTGKIGTVSVKGKSYKGLNGGLSSTSSPLKIKVGKSNYPNKIVYVGVRVSASNSSASSNGYFQVDYSGHTLSTPHHQGGGAFSYFCEIALNTKTGELMAYSNGQPTTSKSVFSTTDKSATMTCGAALALPGVGLVYSDFYIALDDDLDADFSPYGSLRIGSCTAQRFSGNASAFNTLGLDIVSDLNSIFDESYNDVGGFLHMTTTPGTLKYNNIPNSAINIIAVQSTGLTSPPPEGCALSQKMYLSGQKQDITTSRFSGDTPSYTQFNSVVNFSDAKSGSELAGLEVVINAAKT
ncbi:hypothetical protein [Salmonella enterica]|uniref:hypothetical protein n=1 Tax=Salmonella enterica TaxID=28901 RepID=UPI001D890045|nr:hypothetical protein [Salmonella enterica]